MLKSEGRVATSRVLLFWAIALGGCAFDLGTKAYIFAHVGPEGSTRVLVSDVLEFRTSHNPGALWGFGRDVRYSPMIFAGLSVVAGMAICWWLFLRGGANDLRYTIALALIMAGAMGNCYDRLRFGYVRDFVYFHVDAINFRWAIFNFADNMLVFGAAGLLLMALRPDPSLTEPETPVVAVHDDSV